MNSEAMLAMIQDDTRLTFSYFATVEEAMRFLKGETT